MKISIENKQLKASINSQGAELISLKNAAGREFIWEGNPEFWGKHSPVLFPIVGTLKNNQYRYENKTYHLSRHGFARDYEFKVLRTTGSSAVFSLKANAETLKVYPFDFELEIYYELEESNLRISYKITNNTNRKMPFSIGAHPAFALPEPFKNYRLEFGSDETLKSYALENDLLSNHTTTIELPEKQLPLTYSLFENDALIFKEMPSKSISILEQGKPIIGFHFSDFENFGIWTKINAPFICLEPWLGYSDTLESTGNIEDKEAIRFIEPQKEFLCTFKIEIH